MAPVLRRRLARQLPSHSAERTRKAKFVAVRICDVEVTFAPFCVSGLCVGFKSFGDGVTVKRVHVGDVEDGTTPPRPLAIDRLGSEVEIAGADTEAGELVLSAPVPSQQWGSRAGTAMSAS